MNIKETKLKGCFIIEPTVLEDERGYFYESFHQKIFKKKVGLDIDFIQENQSYSKRGALRGLHYQKGKYAQAKLVRVIKGKVLDVIVDIRPESKTYGDHISVELSAENKKQIFIPKGFAHGFVVLSDEAEFFYKCDNFYNAASEGGIIYNDPTLNIDWKLPKNELIISTKDAILPTFDIALTQ